MRKLAIGIDLGGTNLKAAAVENTGRVLARRLFASDAARGPDAVIADMARTVTDLLTETGIPRTTLAGVGVGSPGPLSPRSGVVFHCANLPGWQNVPLRERLAAELRVPVVLENDANAAAYGEFWMGAGRDGADMVILTLGTGVGSGVIIDRRLVHGHFENAGELGHMIVVPDGLPCGCGQRGCLEAYASAGAVARRVAAAVQAREPSALADQVLAGEPIDAAQVVEHARNGDALCLRIWDETCFYLSIACINIQHAFNPFRIVLGGGMSEAGDFLSERVREHMIRRQWKLHTDYPLLALAELGNDAGAIGAAGLVHGMVNAE